MATLTALVLSWFIYGSMFIVGTPLNAILIAMYFSKNSMTGNRVKEWRRQNGTDTLIAILSAVDLVACFLAPLTIIFALGPPSETKCRISVVLSHSFVICSFLLTLLIAVDRYLTIFPPPRWKLSTRSRYILAASCVIVGFVSNIGSMMYAKLVPTNIGVCLPLGTHRQALVVYRWVLSLFCVACFAVILILYGRIYHKIVKQQTRIQVIMKNENSPNGVLNSLGISSISKTVALAQPSFKDHSPISLTCTEKEPCNGENLQLPESYLLEPSSTAQQTSSVRNGEVTAQVKRRTEGGRKNSSHRTTKMVLCVTILVFVVWLPYIIIAFIPTEILNKAFQTHSEWLRPLLFVLYRLRDLYHYLNLFVYLGLNKRFRENYFKFVQERWTNFITRMNNMV